MTRLLLGALGVILLAVVALGVMWLAGQLLVGVGVAALGTAGVLLRLLWFVIVAAGLGGVVFFVANAWRPTRPVPFPEFPGKAGHPAVPLADLRVDARGHVEVQVPEGHAQEAQRAER
ncbi:hypothetical protein [Deinococcus fonticola]|uniref:hypothetical protein n=1 Tax=Deinococcus fonticola TaxID=2528713 RepID=UPI00197A7820|nr:hypothetical protein [Deinococcus fonticola]